MNVLLENHDFIDLQTLIYDDWGLFCVSRDIDDT